MSAAPITYTPPEPGDLSMICAMQSAYYAEHHGLDQIYESVVAAQIDEFLGRYDRAGDFVLTARLDDRLAGAITIDCGGSPPVPDTKWARLRWFIVSDALRGQGAGREMMSRAMAFVRQSGVVGCYLSTFKGLDAAGHLYRDAGFVLTSEAPAETWGKPVIEQRYEWRP